MTDLTNYLSQLFMAAIDALDLPRPSEVTFEHPTNAQFGDYSTNVAMSLFSQLNADSDGGYGSPRALAQALADAVTELEVRQQAWIEQISVAGPGFINLTLNNNYLYLLIHYLLLDHSKVIPDLGHQRKAIVEFSSPNIAKPFTIGHLRSTIIGQALANLLEATGWEVKRDNHVGDWGTQFGKQLYALQHLGAGSLEENIALIEASERPVKILVNLYIEFHQKADADPALEDAARALFKKLEDGDPEARQLWQLCIDWSWVEFNKIYQKLQVSFTENDGRGYGESFFEDKMTAVLDELESNPNLDYRAGKDGAKLVFFPDDELPPLMILKKDGATLYATRDLATDRFRIQTYGPDILVINEVGAEQALYFRQIFRTEELLGWVKPGQRVHVKHGMYRFKDTKMSTRKGNLIWLEDVLAEAEKRAASLAKDPGLASNVSRAIGIGALKWNDLKRSPHLDIAFDWDAILTMQGNAGPYLQYAYVRCHSLLSKAIESGLEIDITKPFDAEAYSLSDEERALAAEFIKFGEAVALAAKEYSPHHLCTYLYGLAQTFSTFYNHHSVLGPDVSSEAQQVRLQLTQVTATILQAGLEILGIEVVEQM